MEDVRPTRIGLAYDNALQLLQHGYLEASQQQAEQNYNRWVILNPVWAAKFQLLEAESMLYRGMYDDALGLLASYPDSMSQEGAVERLAIEAVAFTHQHRLQLAEGNLTQAEATCRSHDFVSCGDVLAAHAILEARLGRFGASRQFFLQALSFARDHHDEWLQVASALNLGYVALQVDHYDEAVDWSRLAYRDAANSSFENFAQGAAGNLGWAYYQLGDEQRALHQFLDAEQTAKRAGDLRNQLKWLSDAGYVYRDSGDLPRAMECYRKAFSLAKQLDSKEDIENALEDLAYLSVVKGDLKAAADYFDQVAPMETAGGGKLSPNLMLTKGKLAVALHQDAEAAADLRSVWNNPDSLTTLRLVAGSELSTLYESQQHAGAAEQMYKSTLAAYESARTTLRKEETQLPFGANATQVYDDYIHLLVGEGRSGEALAIADESRARTLEQGLGADTGKRPLRATAIDPRRKAQVSGSTLLFYWLGERQSYLWAITPAQIKMFPLPPGQQIAARVQSYRNAILNLQDPRKERNQDGLWLYNALVAPARALIQPRKPIVILDDGALSELNFDTLLVPDSEAVKNNDSNATTHYLIEDFVLVSAPSLAMLGQPEKVRNLEAKILLLGNPVSPSQDFPTLPLLGYEMTKIESHFSRNQLTVFAGSQATPAAYLTSHPSQYSYIDFVSHATASSNDPLESAIILSRASADENSFKLYARDIIKKRINAQLVTISACYGSGTRLYAGEGLVGLSWAFLHAGAQRVIGAMWEVSDISTPRLMDSFYGHLANGDSPAASLRFAKLESLHSSSRFSLPFYWAAFQMYDR